MTISNRLRFEILRRDNYICTYCGAKPPNVELTIDHVLPIALGGTDEPTNLTTACTGCNAGKTSSTPDAPLVDSVTDDAARWAAAIDQAARQRTDELANQDELLEHFECVWTKYWLNRPGENDTSSRFRQPHRELDARQKIAHDLMKSD
jgi:hypothetical protein